MLYLRICLTTILKCKVVQSIVGENFAVKDTKYYDQVNKDAKILPDIVIYLIDEAAKKAYTWRDQEDKSDSVNDTLEKDKGKQVASKDDNSKETREITPKDTLTQKHEPFKAHTSWDYMLLMIEVKADSRRKPFTSKSIRPNSDERKKSRGQLAEHIAAMLSHQHLLYAYQVELCKCEARLLRWDRAGVLISKSFNILGKHSPLHRFLFQFSKLDKLQRGADPTASLASDEEI